MFEDDVFPANDASIGTEDAGNYVWRRPHVRLETFVIISHQSLCLRLSLRGPNFCRTLSRKGQHQNSLWGKPTGLISAKEISVRHFPH